MKSFVVELLYLLSASYFSLLHLADGKTTNGEIFELFEAALNACRLQESEEEMQLLWFMLVSIIRWNLLY